ncbi:unnamed protein product [Pleuronectes platessa]|uniref:Fusion protein IQCJ-SCHIP1 N-terminal domain-containing protein n=1 Tax=Pleuronectes platessa TaxID=8262 RepID=A0A9N7VBI9_PLEPL|nr:unnamed protein product [Pleuronectes platessa]
MELRGGGRGGGGGGGGEQQARRGRAELKEQLEGLQSDFKHVNEGGFQLQSNHLTMDLDNNININMLQIENKVFIIQRAWRDFLQRQEAEKRSPSPPSLSSSDKMSMSISMATLSDGSTPPNFLTQKIHLATCIISSTNLTKWQQSGNKPLWALCLDDAGSPLNVYQLAVLSLSPPPCPMVQHSAVHPLILQGIALTFSSQ